MNMCNQFCETLVLGNKHERVYLSHNCYCVLSKFFWVVSTFNGISSGL